MVFLLLFPILFANGIFRELGLTEQFLKNSGYFGIIFSGIVFLDKPHIAISFGFFYYTTLAIITLLLHKTKRSHLKSKKLRVKKSKIKTYHKK